MFPLIKGKKQALVWKFASVTCTAVEFKFLIWQWHQMNLIVGKWLLSFFSRKKSFIFSSGEYKNAGFSKLETQFWRFETLFVWVSSIPLVLACHAMLLSIVWRVKGRLTLLIYSAISQVILTQIKAKVQWNFSPRGVSAYSHEFLTRVKSFSVLKLY